MATNKTKSQTPKMETFWFRAIIKASDSCAMFTHYYCVTLPEDRNRDTCNYVHAVLGGVSELYMVAGSAIDAIMQSHPELVTRITIPSHCGKHAKAQLSPYLATVVNQVGEPELIKIYIEHLPVSGNNTAETIEARASNMLRRSCKQVLWMKEAAVVLDMPIEAIMKAWHDADALIVRSFALPN
jgi:hypothetical protein